MKNVASIVEILVQKDLFLVDALSRKIINYQALAEEFLPRVEQELGKKVKVATIMMALRRYSEKLSLDSGKELLKTVQVELITPISVVTVQKTPTALAYLARISEQKISAEQTSTRPSSSTSASTSTSSFFHVLQGTEEINFILSSSQDASLLQELAKEKNISVKKDLTAVILRGENASAFIPYLNRISFTPEIIVEKPSEVVIVVEQKTAVTLHEHIQKLIERVNKNHG